MTSARRSLLHMQLRSPALARPVERVWRYWLAVKVFAQFLIHSTFVVVWNETVRLWLIVTIQNEFPVARHLAFNWLFACACDVCEGRSAMHRAVEVHGQPVDLPGTDLKGIKDSTDIIRLLVLHGAEINQPVVLVYNVNVVKRNDVDTDVNWIYTLTLRRKTNYTVGHKKGATIIFTITLANVDRFQ